MSEKKERFLEALLFASEGVIERGKVKRFMSLNDEQLNSIVYQLQKKYEQSNSSFKIISSNASIMLTVQDEFVPKIKNFLEAEFSSAVLKTLAIIAYKSPLKQSDVIKARGNKSYGHITNLLNLGLVQAEEQGKTRLLRLTPKFFKYFNVSEKNFRASLQKPKELVVAKQDDINAAEQKLQESVKGIEKEAKTENKKQEVKSRIKEETVQEGDRNVADVFFSA